MEQALHQLSRKDLVRPARRTSMTGQAEYAFHHALVRDVCYGQIPRAERAERHRRAAAWIEGASGARVEDHAAILASHIVAALELAGDGLDAPELRSKATHYLTLAGERSLGIDVEAAEQHFAQALELASDNAPERPGILARHAEALRQRGRFADAAQAYEQAIDGFREQGDIPMMALAMARQTTVFSTLGDPRGRSTADDALRVLEPLGPSPALVAVLAEAAGAYIVWGEPERCVELAAEAIALATELDLPEQPRALGFRGTARADLGDEGGVADIRRALDAAISQGLGREAAVLYFNLAGVLSISEPVGAQLRALEEGLSFAQRRGVEEYVFTCGAEIVAALVELGSYDEVIERARELEPRLEEAEHVVGLVVVRLGVVAVLARRGQLDAALQQSGWTIERAREYENPQILVPCLARGAALQLAAGDLATARALLEELAPLRASMPIYTWVLTDAVRTALGLPDIELARRLAERVPSTPPQCETSLLTVQALIAEHESRHTEAEPGFAQAAQQWQHLEVPWERAQALLGQARCLIALSQTGEATKQLQTARDIFTSLAAMPALAETDALLARASAIAS